MNRRTSRRMTPTTARPRHAAALWPACVVLLLVASCTTPEAEVDPALWAVPPASPAAPAPAAPNVPLRVGDRIELFVIEDDAFSGSFQVRETGHIIMPELGRVMVAGLTPAAAETRIKSLLEDGVLTEATVILDRTRARRVPQPLDEKERLLVYTSGKVSRPGQHSLVVQEGRRLGVFEVILITGGLERFAHERRAYVLRSQGFGERQRIPVDLRAIREGQSPDIPVLEGDIIVVPERTFGI